MNTYVNEYEGSVIPAEEVEKRLQRASIHIDNLTFNRILREGVSSLTNFQLGIIEDVCVQLAEFEYSNQDLIESVLSSYSINGVNMSFDNAKNIIYRNGVVIPTELYEYLSQTGLCCLCL